MSPCVDSGHVALLAEGVDRNNSFSGSRRAVAVALLAEGVDRNSIGVLLLGNQLRVALLAEGVDRNIQTYFQKVSDPRRPPRGGRG